jgi:flagellar hook-associated protein 3 FlgL
MISMLDEIGQLDGVLTKLKSMQDNAAYDQAAVTADIEAVEKAQAYLTDTVQKRFERGITDFQGYLNKANEALTAVGNRSLRLELVENRLNAQMQSFTELTSLNEDADLAELAIRLKSAELTYDASLASTGKMLSTTLLNYL